MILVDERRLAVGTPDPETVTPAQFLERLTGLRVLGEGERRALVRRIAATRPLAIPEQVRRSPSFAGHALSAIDRGDGAPFAELADEYRTLIAFAGAVDAAEALRRALAGAPLAAPVATLAIDDALLADDLGAFGWRRLAALAGFGLEPRDLGPLAAPRVDLVAVASVVAFVRFAASERDADARAALRSKHAPIDPGDARTLLAVAGGRANVLDVIDGGSAGGGREFAHALRSIARSYRLPDASAGDVVDAAARILALAPETYAALARIARDFDRARVIAPQWEASQLCAEFAGELAGAEPAVPAFTPDPPPLAAAEQPLPVGAKRPTFSASALNTFAECERKWYYRYVCNAVEDRGSSASFYGIAFHAALEDFHATHVRFDGVDAAALESFLDYCIAAAFDRHRTRFDAPVEFELQKRRARRTGKRYVRWLIDRAGRAPFAVVGCEVSTEVRLGDYPFIGFIDRLDRDDAGGDVTVVDYKTGAIAKRAADYLGEVLAFREFQLPFYYWARTAAGDRVTRLSLVPLKDAQLDVAPVELLVVDATRSPRPARGGRDATTGTIATGDLERARDRMIAIAALLTTPTIERFAVSSDPDACRYCAYKDACRARPAVAEERFGR